MKKCRVLLLLVVGLSLLGCNSVKKVTYLQDVGNSYEMPLKDNFELTFQPFDEMMIVVNSKEPDLALPFNLATATLRVGQVSSGGQQNIDSYIVGKDGKINFPFLGEISVLDMTRKQLQEYVARRLSEENLLKDAIVTVRFVNFNISVLGEVVSPGSVPITSDRMTILDAISKAGDLTIYGCRENVMLIRERDGKRVITRVDLRSKDLMTSPDFYLTQNDVIYVQPNRIKAEQREINANNSIGVLFSAISLLTSVILLVVNLTASK